MSKFLYFSPCCCRDIQDDTKLHQTPGCADWMFSEPPSLDQGYGEETGAKSRQLKELPRNFPKIKFSMISAFWGKNGKVMGQFQKICNFSTKITS